MTVTTMKTISILAYFLGSILLIASCFTSSLALTWCFGAAAVVSLIVGCVFQFNSKQSVAHTYVHTSHTHNDHFNQAR